MLSEGKICNLIHNPNITRITGRKGDGYDSKQIK
jgi:hypothetical protein